MKKLYSLLVACIATTIGFGQITLVEDINPGTNGSTFGYPYIFDGYIYFRADDKDDAEDHGSELWKSNGSETALIDLKDGLGVDSKPFGFFELNNKLFFSAQAPTSRSNYQWEYDPSTGDFKDIALYNFYSTSVQPVIINNNAYFGRWNDSYHLFQFDGTSEPTRVDNLASGIMDEYVRDIIYYNDKLVLYMKNNLEDKNNPQGTEVGTELYLYDFTSKTYSLIKNIETDYITGPGDFNSSGISNFTILNNTLYFEAQGHLWSTDGEVAEGTTPEATGVTEQLLDIESVSNFFAWNNLLLFKGDDANSISQLFVYDPQTGNATQLSSNGTLDHNPNDYTVAGDGYVYYTGVEDSSTGDPEEVGISYLYRTDGSIIQKVFGNTNFSGFDDMILLDGILYFEATDGTVGEELYKLDPATITANDVATGIEDELYIKNLSLYPNPTKGTINISGLETSDVAYTVYDISGRTIQSGITNTQISLNCAPGIYIIELKDGNKITTHKVQVK